MQEVARFKQFCIVSLTKDLAAQYAGDINHSLDQIPLVDPHSKDALLSNLKGERILHNKWKYSFLALDGDKYAGVVIGYEREKEANNRYPENSIHLGSLAVAKAYQKQGLGRFLVKFWMEHGKQLGFISMKGKLTFSVQTNSAQWNQHVQGLYESFGFKKIAEKKYDKRVVNVYQYKV